jgi:protein involved in polysaccharide export with SLBB domain
MRIHGMFKFAKTLALLLTGALVSSGVLAQDYGQRTPLQTFQGGPSGFGDLGTIIAPPRTPIITNQPFPSSVFPGYTGYPGYPGITSVPPAMGASPPGMILPGQPIVIEFRDRNEFQDYILEMTGRDLPLFGLDLFRYVPTTFAPVDNVPVTSDYVIGAGDEMVIRAWGQIDVDFRAVVDRNGTISVPRVGVIKVAGIKSQDLDAFLRTAFSRVFRNFELTASLGALRAIQVFVVGQARRPGTYTVSSLSTLVNAIFAAGGPTSKGSMRAIQLKRGNSIVTELDLYDLVISGDKSKDARLLPGDVIYFPPIGSLAAVTGSINVPGIYELKGDVPLGELLRWAGGLAAPAQGQRVTVERIQDRKVRKVDELALDSAGHARTLRNGDLVTVYAITPRFDATVTLRGNVAQPARYPWREGLRVRDLIPEKEALLTREYWTRRNQLVFPLSPDQARAAAEQLRTNLVDQMRISADAARALGDIRQSAVAGAAGAVQDSRQQDQRQQDQRQQDQRLLDQRLQDQRLQLETARRPAVQSTVPTVPSLGAMAAPERPEFGRFAGEFAPQRALSELGRNLGEVNWDYAVIERLSPKDLSTSLIPFNLGKAVLEGDPQHNILLQPADVITVFSKDDMLVPRERQSNFIRLEGEFNNAGVYRIQPGETLRQLIARVGGLSPHAYLFGAEFTRISTQKEQQKRLDEALTRLEQDVQRAAATRAASVVSVEDASALQAQAESQRQLIARLRQLRPSGRIVLELPEDATLKHVPDLPLEDGDRFVVPSRPSMVNVFGSVYNETAFVYKPEKRVADYLSQAGGVTRSADSESIYVLRADGSVISKRQSGFFAGSLEGHRLMPGDTIVVPEEFDKVTLTRKIKDFAQIFYQFGLGAAAIKVLQ